MIKLTIFLRRREGMSHEEFICYHENNHAPLFRSLPEVKLYVRNYVQYHTTTERSKEMILAPYDGSAEIWFDDLKSMFKLFEASNYQIIYTDQQHFLDLDQSCIEMTDDFF